MSTRVRQRLGSQRGAGTIMIACVLMALCLASVVAVWIAGWIASAHRVNAAADLAALAGAQAHVRGEGPCPAARAAAARNGGELTACSLEGGQRDFVVRVRVRGELTPTIGGTRRWFEAPAVAGSLARR